MPPPSRLDNCHNITRRTIYNPALSLRAREGVAISCGYVQIRTLYQEIATSLRSSQ